MVVSYKAVVVGVKYEPWWFPLTADSPVCVPVRFYCGMSYVLRWVERRGGYSVVELFAGARDSGG